LAVVVVQRPEVLEVDAEEDRWGRGGHTCSFEGVKDAQHDDTIAAQALMRHAARLAELYPLMRRVRLEGDAVIEVGPCLLACACKAQQQLTLHLSLPCSPR
jgi:hypothetical protein